MASPMSLILTLHMDGQSARSFTDLRDAHFPSEINYLPAHITLFHNLPANEMPQFLADAGECLGQRPEISVKVTGLRFLGRGVAYKLESPQLTALRRCLADRWNQFLRPQDRQPFQPHITVQNKVEPAKARLLYQELAGMFQPRNITGTGLDFWYYRGGPWEHARFVEFRAGQ